MPLGDEPGDGDDGHEDNCGSLLECFRDACTDPALSDLMRDAGLFSVEAGMTELEPQ